MRNSAEFRAWKLDRLRSVQKRPSMFAVGAVGADTLMRDMFEDLAYIDDNEHAYQEALKAVTTRYNSYGIAGLKYWFHDGSHIGCAEVMSVYVEFGHQLGWIDVDRVLDDDDFDRLGFADPSSYRERDQARSELAERLGRPSVAVGTSTWCFFVDGDDCRWVYLDFDAWPPPSPDPLLRNLRLPAAKARDGLVFSPTGRSKYHPHAPR